MATYGDAVSGGAPSVKGERPGEAISAPAQTEPGAPCITQSQLASSGADARKPVRRLQTSVRTLVVLVACCGLIFWAARRLWDNSDPVLVEARSIQQQAIAALRSGKPAKRTNAAHELQRLQAGDRAVAIPPLIGALDDQETEVRVAAADALGSISRSPTLQSSSGREAVRKAATALIRCLQDSQPDVRVMALTSLWSMATPSGAAAILPPSDHQDVIDALVPVLGDRDAKVRLAAINALVSLRSGTGPPKALLSALDDASAENRATAIRSLRFYGQGLNPFVPALIRLASKDPDPSVQDEILSMWDSAVLRPPAVTAEVVPSLIASLRSSDFKVRVLAARLLPQFRAAADEAIPELLRVLNEPLEPGVATMANKPGIWDPAIQAAWALERIAPGSAEEKKVLAAMIAVVRSGPPSRRAWVASALSAFGADAVEAAPDLIHVIEQSARDQNEDSTFFVGRVGGTLAEITAHTPAARQAVAALLGLLDSKEIRIRVGALQALEQFGPSAAAAIPRIRALKNDRELPVREAAETALSAIEKQTVP